MQRSHTLLIVLTMSAACGSPTERPQVVQMHASRTVAIADGAPPTPAPLPPPPPPPPPTPPPEPPKLTCEDGTTVVPAKAPEPSWYCTRADGKRHGPFFTLFPDLTIAIEGTYKDGKLSGPWTRHHPGGALAEQGQYTAGLPDGTWQQLAPDGSKLGEYKLKAGTGVQKRWLDDGPLYSEVTLRKGVPSGKMFVHDRDGRILIKATIFKGKLHDEHEMGWKNTLRIEETFKYGVRTGPRKIWQFWNLVIEEAYDDKGKLDGPFTIWRDKNLPRVQGEYAHGLRTGSWVWTDKKKQTEREGTYADGKKTGPWTEYDDGKVTFTGNFTDGKPDGDFVYTDKNGVEIGRYTITAGTGTVLTFHSNKKPSSKTKLVDGEMSGKYEELTPRGKVLVEGYYQHDKKHGTWKEQTELGIPISEVHWRSGKLHGAVKKFIDGKLSVESSYKDGKVDGPYTEYRDGKPSLVGQFTADRRTGTWKILDANGAETLVATYNDGVLDGPWREVTREKTVDGQLSMGRPSGTWTYSLASGDVSRFDQKTP